VVGEVGSGNPQAPKFNNVGANTTASNSGIRFGGTKELSSQNIAELDGYYSNKSTFFYTPYYDSAAAIGVGNYGAGNSNLNGWTMNLSPRFKSTFNGFGSGILGYEFNQSSQGGYNAYSPNTYAAMLAANKIKNPSSTEQSTQSASQLNQSIYGILKLALVESIDFSGGFRHQTQSATAYDNSLTTAYNSSASKNASKTFSANAGDLALNYNYQKNQRIYIKWNQSYRFPNIDEYWGWDQVTYNRAFSGILKPQTTQAYELGGDWLISNLKLHGAAFSSVTENEIRYDVDSGNNINSDYYINRRGINLDVSSSLTNRLTLAAGGQFQNSVYANGPYAGYAVALAPNLLLNARANYAVDSKWSLGGVVNFVSSQRYDTGVSAWTDYNSLSQMPAYTTGDVFVNYAEKQLDVKFIVKNVGNARYATTGGYAFITNASGTSGYNYYYYPSDGRSVFLTAKYSFN
jgi:iron complex outermembrane receptor protein